MKYMYAWVPWFRQLAARVAEGGERRLIECAKRVDWKVDDPALLRHGDENIDPLSFLYFLSSRLEAMKSVHSIFSLEERLPAEKDWAWIFPQAIRLKTQFINPEDSSPSILWRLFRQAQPTKSVVDGETFRSALGIKGVGVPSLTQALCLVNAEAFLPVDRTIEPIKKLTAAEKKRFSLSDYYTIMDQARDVFPACSLPEISRFLYTQWSEDGEFVAEHSKFFHISTNVFADDRNFWPEFEESNSVFVGGIPPRRKYPITKPKFGDIVLVRFGRKTGLGIGVVLENEYKGKKGFAEDARIHVLWINATEASLSRQTAEDGLGRANPARATFAAFAESAAYRPTLQLLEKLGVKMQRPPNPTPAVTHPLNQIHYGPPGTGKTWRTVACAVAIVDGKDVNQVEQEREEDPEAVKSRFDRLRETGQVAMVTFHQNYAYEDFVEGIRPVLSKESDADVEFVLRWGIFREIAEAAKRNRRASRDHSEHLDVEGLVDNFLDFVEARIDDGEELVLEVPESKHQYPMVEVVRQGHGRIRLRGPNNGIKGLSSLVWRKIYGDLDKKINSSQDIGGVPFTRGRTHTNARFHYAMLRRLKQYQENEWKKKEHRQEERKNFVLILDEINRGNIARIFGELITLVERSRRIGGDDETWVTLPNSGDEFGVPDNLYLIGTMNTADRSIALLDTALRRRFEFEEMMPNADHPKMKTDIEGVNLRDLLKAMNKRIRFLRDREHQIGHTYFLGVSDIEGLKKAFQKQILPLLQEYFYDDWAKIRAVLRNNGFVRPVECPKDLAVTGLVDSDAEAFEMLGFQDPKWKEPASYRSIYEAKAAEDESAGAAKGDAEADGSGD